MSIAAVILAAGASRRLGRPKQLIEYRGENLLARAIRLAREAGFDPVIVVLGAERDGMRAAVPAKGVKFVLNEAWQEGIASSIRAGLVAVAEIAPDAAVLVMPCDQPHLTAEHLSRLANSFVDGAIVASVYAGVRGVPAVFPPIVLSDLMGLSGDKGARGLLAAPPCAVIEIPFAGGEIDIDFPEDLARLQ
jgi:molybdenum cofactor cytidylyltransferase